jgi:hypothetical protein
MSAARGAAVTAEKVTRHLDAIRPTSAFSAERSSAAGQCCASSGPLRVRGGCYRRLDCSQPQCGRVAHEHLSVLAIIWLRPMGPCYRSTHVTDESVSTARALPFDQLCPEQRTSFPDNGYHSLRRGLDVLGFGWCGVTQESGNCPCGASINRRLLISGSTVRICAHPPIISIAYPSPPFRM